MIFDFTKPIIFIGSNANILTFVESAERQGFKIAGIFDSDHFGNTNDIDGIPVIGTEHWFDDLEKLNDFKEKYNFFIGTNWSPDVRHVRDTQKRKTFIEIVKSKNIECVNIIDPSSQVSNHATVGKGVFVGSMCHVEPHAILGDFAQIWHGTIVSHAKRVGENTILQRQVTVNAHVGDNSYIGVQTILHSPKHLPILGNNVIVSAALHVSRDVADGEIVRISKDSFKTYRNFNPTT